MNDKERLEVLEDNVTGIYNLESGEIDGVELLVQDFKWLIAQAERAQELEMKYRNTGSVFNRQFLHSRIVELEHQNKRYREALEQIANSRITIADGFGNVRIARQALEGDGE